MSCSHLKFDSSTPGIDRLGLGVAALAYQGAGYCVLPLIRGGKKPHRMLPESGGVHHGSRLVTDVPRWWGADPAANIGVATGIVSNLMVVDLDVKGAHNGPRVFWEFCHGQPDLPAGCYVRTPSGGSHLWFRTPKGVPVAERPGILPGVDIKGNGGLVVAPPSMQLTSPMIRPGERGGEQVPVPYEARGCPLCQVPLAPPWLLEWAATAAATGTSNPDGGDSLVIADVETLKRTGIARGQRNSTFYRLACQLYRRHGTGTQGASLVAGQVQLVWSASDRTDMPWREVLVTIESARRFIEHAEQQDQLLMEKTMGWLNR